MRLARPGDEAQRVTTTSTKLTELDRRSAAAGVSLGSLTAQATHTFTLSGSIAAGADSVQLTGFAEEINDGLVTFTNGSEWTLNEPGRWMLHYQMLSDSTSTGVFIVRAKHNTYFGQYQDLVTGGYTGGGFSGAGYDRKTFTYMDYIDQDTIDQSTDTIKMYGTWYVATAGIARSYAIRLVLNYFGGLGEELTSGADITIPEPFDPIN